MFWCINHLTIYCSQDSSKVKFCPLNDISCKYVGKSVRHSLRKINCDISLIIHRRLLQIPKLNMNCKVLKAQFSYIIYILNGSVHTWLQIFENWLDLQLWHLKFKANTFNANSLHISVTVEFVTFKSHVFRCPE